MDTLKLKDFVSTEEKVDLIGLSILEASIEGFINPMLLEIFYRINLVLTYCENDFTEEEKMDKLALYDTLMYNGSLAQFVTDLEAKNPGELEYLDDSLEAWATEVANYKTSLAGVFNGLKTMINNALLETGNSLEQLKGLDMNKIEELLTAASNWGMEKGQE